MPKRDPFKTEFIASKKHEKDILEAFADKPIDKVESERLKEFRAKYKVVIK